MFGTNAILCFALLFVAAAAAYDLRTGQIPNRLTLASLVVGALLQLTMLCWFDRPAAAPLQLSLLALAAARVVFGMLVCALVPYLLFLRNGMGGGDVKLLAAVGASLGPVTGLEVELYAFVAMALVAPAQLAYQGRLTQVLGNAAALLMNPMLPQARRRPVAPELFSSFKFGPAVLAAMALVALLRWRGPA